jgi:glycosyltransferase involved in cell wall biosynthesis
MKVGINASFLRKPGTGIGQVTQHVAAEFSRRFDNGEFPSDWKDAECIVYTEETPDIQWHLPSRMRIETLVPRWWRRDDLIRKIIWERWTLPKRAKRDGCDVLLSLYQSATEISARSGGMRHVMVAHDIIPTLFPEYGNNVRKRIYRRLIERAIRTADHVVTVSQRTAEDVIEHLGLERERISVLALDVDPIFKRPVPHETSRDVLERYGLHAGYLYTGGGLEKRKNIDGLILAYGLLVKMYEKEHCLDALPLLAISGKLMPKLAPLVTDVERLVNECGLTDRVKILGYVAQEDLPALYANASLFAYPSRYEGFGMPLLEAMSAGTACVSSQTSSLPEVGGDAVRYAASCEPSDLADAIRSLLEDKDERVRLGRLGRKRALAFSWKKFVDGLVRVISKS